MAQIPLDKAHLIAVILEGIFYGLFAACGGVAVYPLVKRPGKINFKLLCTVILMFMISTGHISVISALVIQGFIYYKDGPPLEYFNNLANPLIVAHGVLFTTQTLIGDSFLIYRCYIVWGRTRYIVILPILTMLATGTGGYGGANALRQIPPGTPFADSTSRPWYTFYSITTFCTNVICTVLIAFKIFYLQRHLRGMPGDVGKITNASHSAVAIVIESAGVIMITITCYVATYLTGSNGLYIIGGVTNEIIGLSFTIIILRISLDMSSFGGGQADVDSWQATTIGGSRRRVRDGFELKSNCSNPVSIRVNQYVESDNGSYKASAFSVKSIDEHTV